MCVAREALVFGRRSLAVAVAVTLFVGEAVADEQTAVEKLVQMNQNALGDYQAFQWNPAKNTLLEALLVAKKAELTNHPLMARTYVNLGAVYLTGFKDRDKAIQCFSIALEIDPVIQLSQGMATDALNEAFAAAKRGGTPSRAAPARADGERDLPVRIMALDCPNGDEAIIDRPVTLRCALAPNLNHVATVFLMYREPGKETYAQLQMTRSPKGWYLGTIPKRAMTGKAVAHYFEGRDASGKPVIRNGDLDSPNFILLMEEDAYDEMRRHRARRHRR